MKRVKIEDVVDMLPDFDIEISLYYVTKDNIYWMCFENMEDIMNKSNKEVLK